jgi:hypothetical protein
MDVSQIAMVMKLPAIEDPHVSEVLELQQRSPWT